MINKYKKEAYVLHGSQNLFIAHINQNFAIRATLCDADITSLPATRAAILIMRGHATGKMTITEDTNYMI